MAATEAATETMKVGGREGKNTREKRRAHKARTQERVPGWSLGCPRSREDSIQPIRECVSLKRGASLSRCRPRQPRFVLKAEPV